MRRPLLLLLTLSACAGPVTKTGPWSGDVTPRAVTNACFKTRGLAQIRGDLLTFIPNSGTWVLTGTAESDGRATAERIQPGANKLPFETRFEGRWTDTTLDGTYTTPSCVYDVRLTRG